MFSNLLDWLVFLLPLVLGIIGTLFSLRAPRESSHRAWSITFAVSLIVTGALAYCQQSLGRRAHDREVLEQQKAVGGLQAKLQETETKNASDMGYLRGQLDTIAKFVGNPPPNTDVRRLADAVSKMASPTGPPPDRQLTLAQRDLFLRQLTERPGKADIAAVAFDSREAKAFADELHRVFEQASWQNNGWSFLGGSGYWSMITKFFPKGIAILARERNWQVSRMECLFTQIGLKPNVDINPSSKYFPGNPADDPVVVLIGEE